MGAVRGFVTTVLGLVALETVVSTQGAADRTAGLLGGVAGIIDAVFNPAIPAIRDRSGTGLDVAAPAPATDVNKKGIPLSAADASQGVSPAPTTPPAPTGRASTRPAVPGPVPSAAPPTGQG